MLRAEDMGDEKALSSKTTRKIPRNRLRVPNQKQRMAAFIAPQTTKETIRVRQFNICQYDLLGSTQVCTAIAVVAARDFHRVGGQYDEIFRTDTQVMQILSEGVVWHSRWLALDTDGSRTAFEVDAEDDDNGLISMATPDEICALPAMDMEVTDVRYEGTLIPQPGRDHYGYSVTEAIQFIFSGPPKPASEDEEDSSFLGQSQEDTCQQSALKHAANGTGPQNGTACHGGFSDISKTSASIFAEQPDAKDGLVNPPSRPPPPANFNGRVAAPQSGSAAPGGSRTPPEDAGALGFLKRVSNDIMTTAKTTIEANAGAGAVAKPAEPIETYIFTSRGYSTLIARKGQSAMVFDSHQRDRRGMANKEEGKAVCVFCDGPHSLARYIRALYGTKPLALFTLQQVVPRESSEKIQYGATSVISKPKLESPAAGQQPSSVSAMAANAGNVAAARIAELGASFKKMSFFNKQGQS